MKDKDIMFIICRDSTEACNINNTFGCVFCNFSWVMLANRSKKAAYLKHNKDCLTFHLA